MATSLSPIPSIPPSRNVSMRCKCPNLRSLTARFTGGRAKRPKPSSHRPRPRSRPRSRSRNRCDAVKLCHPCNPRTPPSILEFGSSLDVGCWMLEFFSPVSLKFGVWSSKFLLLSLLAGSNAFSANPSFTQTNAHPSLFLIGDSTVNNSTKGLQGWGTPIAAFFDQTKINVQNKARGGRSSRTYYTEGLWEEVRKALKPGDFVLMQFGHNDGGPLSDGRARASLKGNGDETQEIENKTTGKKEIVYTYGWYLRKYISEAKAAGTTPTVLSLVPRNIWNQDKVVRAELNAASVVEGLRALKSCPLAGYLKSVEKVRLGPNPNNE